MGDVRVSATRGWSCTVTRIRLVPRSNRGALAAGIADTQLLVLGGVGHELPSRCLVGLSDAIATFATVQSCWPWLRHWTTAEQPHESRGSLIKAIVELESGRMPSTELTVCRNEVSS